ncbi:hypothetical protein C8Q76DRAFT_797183 [Earliella scabrosa]|nr:hypothetical protein C8Q76DRAFT_797183 [Earliella scabrosa]
MPRFDQLPPNLIRTICECLIQPSEGLERRLTNRSLVALALTCHAVLEPALDTIWHTLPDTNIVIFTIPRKRCQCTVRVATLGGDGFHEPVMNVEFVRPLEECDLERLRYYAPRVKAIEQVRRRPMLRWTVRPDAFALLAESCNAQPEASVQRLNAPLFPNLRTLRDSLSPWLDDTKEDDLPRWQLVWGPGLQTLDMEDFSGRRLPIVPSRSLSDAIVCFDRLTCVHTGHYAISTAAIRHLSRLPNLERLGLATDESFTQDLTGLDGSSSSENSAFCALRELSIRTKNGLALPTRVVPLVQSRHLQKVKVEAAQTDPDHIRAFFRAVGQHESRQTIKTVSLVDSTWDQEHAGQSGNLGHDTAQSPSPALWDDAFAPLYDLPNLEKFRIATGVPVYLTDATLAAMSAAWPNIRKLRLDVPPVGGKARVTGNALVALALNGPRQLTHLRVDLDFERAPEERIDQRCCPLRYLDVGGSEIGEPCTVAAFLSCVAPNLRGLSYRFMDFFHMWIDGAELLQPGYSPADAEVLAKRCAKWGKVFELTDNFVTVRGQERKPARRRSTDL